MTEQELVCRAQQGDEQAFAQLMQDNQTRIYTLCLRLSGSPEDAQDLAQEAFLNAWRGLAAFKGESSFATWVYRLASNVCLDFLRRRRRRAGVEGGPSLNDEQTAWAEPPDPRPEPEDSLLGRERQQAVSRALDTLPPHHRQVLVMRELSGLSYQEISQVLELDLGTVKSRIARARLALRRQLLEQGNFF